MIIKWIRHTTSLFACVEDIVGLPKPKAHLSELETSIAGKLTSFEQF
jgi:hypothetical protein